jgi:hypothetical protein
MALMRSFKNIELEQESAPRFATVIAWTRRDGWRLALGFGISVWGIVASLNFLG